MKILKRIGIALAAIVLLLIVISLFLSSDAQVSRSISINAPIESVFEQVNRISIWEEWGGPWQVNPNVHLSFEGAEEGVGALLLYDHPDTGEGTVEIIESTPTKRLKTEITFADQTTANGNWTFVESGSGTDVTWRIDVNLGNNPLKKILGSLMIDGQVGPEFELGLARLKEVAEGSSTN